jgi:hypothetical protein
MDNLVERYRYNANYIPDYEEFKRQVLSKTIIPHQVEFQPGPVGVGNICWLKCPYCYGGSAIDTGERLSVERYINLIGEIAERGVNKVIFAGYATDPLNYTYMENMLSTAIGWGLVWGFNTKLIHIGYYMLKLLASRSIIPKSYISISVDAGTNSSYNLVHGTLPSAKLYDRVLDNTRRIGEARESGGGLFDMSATYLVCGLNSTEDEIRKFVSDFKGAGCNLIRFTFPQPPRGRVFDRLLQVPNEGECEEYKRTLLPIIEELNDESCKVIFVDADREHAIYQKPRTSPCVARWVYPTIGFDGWLYHCSQSSAPNFRAISLGNLNERGFWDCYYDYDVGEGYFERLESRMEGVGCRCDRKEHLVNKGVKESGIWK